MLNKKIIEIHLTLGAGTFRNGENTKILRGLNCDVTIKKPGLPDKNSCEVIITNMLLQDMKQFTMLGYKPLEANPNKISIYAGTEDNLSLAFSGDIYPGGANADFSKSPDAHFIIKAQTGYQATVTPQAPISVKGPADAAGLVQQIAEQMGYTFKNLDVQKSISSPYLSGDAMKKMRDVAKAIRAELIIDDNEIILSTGTSRTTSVVLLNHETGLVKYPVLSQNGLKFECVYNPSLMIGGLAQIESDLPEASGIWRIISLTHHLSSEKGGGDWKTSLQGTYVN